MWLQKTVKIVFNWNLGKKYKKTDKIIRYIINDIYGSNLVINPIGVVQRRLKSEQNYSKCEINS